MTSAPLFQTRQGPLAVLVAGTGGIGLSWCRAICAHPDLRLAALADVDQRRARGVAIRLRHPELPVAGSLAGLAAVPADVCVNATPPDAHRAVTAAALERGLAVLTEKPFAATLTEAVQLTAAARAAGQLLMVSQSRSYQPGLTQLRDLVAGLGRLGLVSTELSLAYRPGGFRAAMAQPLLLDMAVHAFDAVRLVTGARPVRVWCTTADPPWNWFAGPAAATAVVELTGGIHHTFTGSWCSEGLPTSWNGRWRVSGEHGTACWDGDGPPRAEPSAAGPVPPTPVPLPPAAGDEAGLAAPLADFVYALRTGTVPWGECGDNVLTMATTEAAIRAAATGAPVAIGPLLSQAQREAALCA